MINNDDVRFLILLGFPYFHEKSKSSSEAYKQRYHLIGVLAHGVGSWVYTMSDKWKSDSNVTIEVLQRVLTDIERKKGLPRKLYLQMDNCVRENKNKYVLGYLSWLVERGVFEEIELSFLPVGHTHEDIDQLFSRLAIALRGRNAVDRTELYTVIRDAYVKWDQPPCCVHLESVANMSAFLEPYLEPIFNHAGRETLHFLIEPHGRGASIRTKPSAATQSWEQYPNGIIDGNRCWFRMTSAFICSSCRSPVLLSRRVNAPLHRSPKSSLNLGSSRLRAVWRNYPRTIA